MNNNWHSNNFTTLVANGKDKSSLLLHPFHTEFSLRIISTEI